LAIGESQVELQQHEAHKHLDLVASYEAAWTGVLAMPEVDVVLVRRRVLVARRVPRLVAPLVVAEAVE
jgi:hypothetical protein